MAIAHFFVDTEYNDDNAYKEAMKYACELADANASIKRVILLARTQNTVDWLERAFDTNTVKQLFKGMTFKNCRPVFKIETVKTYKGGYNAQDVIITLALDDEHILPLDDLYSTVAVIAVPWQKSGIQQYLNTWNPTDIRGGQPAVAALAEPSCIVKKALEQLTNSINRTTGINNPHDNNRAKTMVLALHKYEPELDEDLVSAYLIRELGWDTGHAADVAKLIAAKNQGRSFQGGTKTGLQHLYKAWKEACK
ncbi:hypothetical protein [Mucilaginibacter sp. dw_454]|uniref:hypothetical protein n=1 Tax=Mucilaginibacter sp. dw_454 TaxID=2720079 RepID=UPI001BD3BB43|nr:hypothetical protein [Mucilaginibacter sp. dw_454]